MKILAVESLNTSIKFNLFDMINETVITEGDICRIGLDESFYTVLLNGETIKEIVELPTHEDAVKILVDKLITLNFISSIDEIKGIGHRVVHGGTNYKDSVIINDTVIEDIERLTGLAPLHNNGAIKGINAFRSVFPEVINVAVFDTAFYQTIDEESYLYPVPYEWYEKYGVRKYGFHGISHKYITNLVRDMLGKEDFKLISCHLGNGGSVSAIKNMEVVDTSMGFTPLSGIMMGTRSGDIDPAIIPYIMELEGKNAAEVVEDLNKNSGLLGLSQFSSDMRDILEQCDNGNSKAILAKNKFVRRVVDYIAEYYVLLGGVDVIVFTAGIGENSVPIRREICERLACLGIKIDLDLNNIKGEQVTLSTNDSSTLVIVIPTDERLLVAKETLELVKNRSGV